MSPFDPVELAEALPYSGNVWLAYRISTHTQQAYPPHLPRLLRLGGIHHDESYEQSQNKRSKASRHGTPPVGASVVKQCWTSGTRQLSVLTSISASPARIPCPSRGTSSSRT